MLSTFKKTLSLTAGFSLFMLTVLVFIMPAIANASQTIEVNWKMPTQKVNGDTLSQSEIKGFRIYYEIDGEVDEESLEIDVGPVTTAPIPLDLPTRLDPYTVQVAIRTLAVTGQSDLSNVVTKKPTFVSSSKPGPPIIIDMQILCDETCKVLEITTGGVQ